ncbi:MAG: hypothetical protein J5482_03210 [Oscillospiraceae bacterium]|nr:hypothetical protein [Oscillospiraceae bacterium]
MFFFERLIGIGCYTLVLLFVLLLLRGTNIKTSKILFFYLVGLALMALYYKPYKTADLYRIFEIVRYYGRQSWKTFFENTVKGSLSPTADIMYWVFGRLQIAHLLPVFSCVTCYSVIFYVIADCSERFHLQRKNTTLLLFFVMASGFYIPVIGGIRMMMSLCILLFCFYRTYILKKVTLIHIVLYLLALTIHAMAVAVIAVALFSLVFGKITKVRYKILLLLFLIAAAFELNRFVDLTQLLEEKASFYLYEDTYFDIWEFIIGLISVFFELILLLRVRKGSIRLRFFEMMTVFCVLIAAVFITRFSIFHRFCVETALLMALPLAAVSVSPDASDTPNSFFRQWFAVWSLLLLIANAGRGTLSGLKFFELP